MTDARDVIEWGEHADELIQRDYLVFNGLHIAVRPDPGPSSEALLWLRKNLFDLQVRKVLDLGCNVGLYAGLFEGFDYVGIDNSVKAIDMAKKTFPDLDFRVLSANNMSAELGEEQFDLIFTRAVLQHNCIGEDKNDVIREMFKVLRPGSYYMCFEGSLLSHKTNPPDFEHHSDAETRKWFEPLGFKLLEHPEKHLYLFQKHLKEK